MIYYSSYKLFWAAIGCVITIWLILYRHVMGNQGYCDKSF